jgi:hypothetical protein
MSFYFNITHNDLHQRVTTRVLFESTLYLLRCGFEGKGLDSVFPNSQINHPLYCHAFDEQRINFLHILREERGGRGVGSRVEPEMMQREASKGRWWRGCELKLCYVDIVATPRGSPLSN